MSGIWRKQNSKGCLISKRRRACGNNHALDRLFVTTHPDGTTTQYTAYDALGNLLTHIGPDGLATHTEYDRMGRPATQSFEHLAGRVDPGATTWTYDPLGRILETANNQSSVAHTYDTLGNMLSETTVIIEQHPKNKDLWDL